MSCRDLPFEYFEPPDEYGPIEDPVTLLHFAQWAFTWDGFPQLQVLAFGACAYDGRDPDDKYILFCRNPHEQDFLAFQMITKAWGTDSHNPLYLVERELIHFEGIHNPFEFLGACPVEGLCEFLPQKLADLVVVSMCV